MLQASRRIATDLQFIIALMILFCARRIAGWKSPLPIRSFLPTIIPGESTSYGGTQFIQIKSLYSTSCEHLIDHPDRDIPVQSIYDVSDGNGKIEYGDYKLIASQEKNLLSKRYYHPFCKLSASQKLLADAPKIGEKIWLRGRISSVRAKGNACFIVLRQGGTSTIQACHFKSKDPSLSNASKQLIKYVSGLTLESIVDVFGTLVAADVKACSQNDVEIQIEKIFALSRAPAQLPFLLEDAARSQNDIDESLTTERPLGSVSQDIRLNNRWLDLRVPANNNIMKIRSAISFLFREALLKENFIEINTPKLIPGESEGGSEVFRTDYFGQSACLAQSPQLYKQMAISSDLDRVFEIGPVFRAEKSMTRRHLCEFTGLDIEMAIDTHYDETLGG